jgi:regulator of sigma E protease
MLSFLSFILAVFPIVIIHEFGHFLVGKYLGAQPEEFSVGFGRQIFGFRWMDANFKIGWIPLGGYVKFKKVQFEVEFGEGEKQGEKIAPWRWFFISIAGPATNMMLTFVIFFGFMVTALGTINGGLVQKSEFAGAPVGSKVIQVDSSGIMGGMVKKTLLGIDTPTKSSLFLVKPDGSMQALELKPGDEQRIEISPKPVLPLGERMAKSVEISFALMGQFFKGTTDAILNLASLKGARDVMGPIGIAGEAEKARSEGIISFIFLIASLSFAIGYFNLLPLSFFDGGRALLALAEQVSKKPISMKVLGYLNTVGLVIVVALLLTGTTSDIFKLLGK